MDKRRSGGKELFFLHCAQCLKELPAGATPRDWARLEVVGSDGEIRVRCVRHSLPVGDPFRLAPTLSADPDAWICTYTGRRVNPLDLRPDDIDIEDIAHALSQVNRYTGHTRVPFSVSQHSCYVSDNVPDEHKLWGLLHDATEYLIADIARPIKVTAVFDEYRKVEKKIMQVIAKKYGLSWPEPDEVKAADTRMITTEKRDLLPQTGEGTVGWQVTVDPYPFKIERWTARRAKNNFLRRFYLLYDEGSEEKEAG